MINVPTLYFIRYHMCLEDPVYGDKVLHLIQAPFWNMKKKGAEIIDELSKKYPTIRDLCLHLLQNPEGNRDLLVWVLSRPDVTGSDARARLVYTYLKPFRYLFDVPGGALEMFRALEQYVNEPYPNDRAIRGDLSEISKATVWVAGVEDTIIKPAFSVVGALCAYTELSDVLFDRMGQFEYLMGPAATLSLNQALREVKPPFDHSPQ